MISFQPADHSAFRAPPGIHSSKGYYRIRNPGVGTMRYVMGRVSGVLAFSFFVSAIVTKAFLARTERHNSKLV
jgi:hypothetical protein